MKKIAAILLLTVFLFNLAGYRLWFEYAQQQSDNRLEISLDKHNYNDADLITIRVPLSMPYQTLQSDFERVNGEMNVNGKIYKYVKRKIENGDVVLLCLPDQNKMRLQSAKNDFFKSTNDISQNNSSQKNNSGKTGIFKNLLSDFEKQSGDYSLTIPGAPDKQYKLINSLALPFLPHTPPVQPPDVNLA